MALDRHVLVIFIFCPLLQWLHNSFSPEQSWIPRSSPPGSWPRSPSPHLFYYKSPDILCSMVIITKALYFIMMSNTLYIPSF